MSPESPCQYLQKNVIENTSTILTYISLLNLVYHLIFSFPRLPLFVRHFFFAVAGLRFKAKTSTNTKALRHGAEKTIFGRSRTKSSSSPKYFFLCSLGSRHQVCRLIFIKSKWDKSKTAHRF